MKKDRTLKEVEDSLAVSQSGALTCIRVTGFLILVMFGTAWLLTSGILPPVDLDVTSLFGKMFGLGIIVIIGCCVVTVKRMAKVKRIERKLSESYITHDIRLTERNLYT